MITKKGAWFYHYQKGMKGTLGEYIDSDSDHLGWALVFWKRTLASAGYAGAMNLSNAVLGDAFDAELRKFQQAQGLSVDGIIGPLTGSELIVHLTKANEHRYGIPKGICYQMIHQESDFDIGAIGSDDIGDRGLLQFHLPRPGWHLSLALDPTWVIPFLAAQLHRLFPTLELRASIASWNIGEGGAKWWHEHGEPTTGSPAWWSFSDMSARATGYVNAISAVPVPY